MDSPASMTAYNRARENGRGTSWGGNLRTRITRVSLALLVALTIAVPARAQTLTVAPSPLFTGFDSNGALCSLCALFIYQAGTTTPATTWIDSLGATPNNQPFVTLSAIGTAVIYLSPSASYRFDLKTPTGALIWSRDNVAGTFTNGNVISALAPFYYATVRSTAIATTLYCVQNGSNPADELLETTGSSSFAITLDALANCTLGRVFSVKTKGTGIVTLTGNGAETIDGVNTYVLGAKNVSLMIYKSGATEWSIQSTDLPQAPITQAVSTTGSINNLAVNAGTAVLKFTNASLTTVTGLLFAVAPVDGQILDILSTGAGQVDLAHENASSTAANRFTNKATSGNTSLAPGSGSARYVYNATSSRWVLLQHEQGAWITRTFSAGNYGATGGSWTVASATTDAYWLKGRTLTYAAEVSGSITSTPSTANITLPFTSAKAMAGVALGVNNTTVATVEWSIVAASTSLLFTNYTGNWGTTAAVNEVISIEVQ